MVWYNLCTLSLLYLSLLLYVCYNCYDIVIIYVPSYNVIVYFDYVLSIARLSLCSCISSYSAHSKDPWVGGRHCVSMVLIRCLPTDTPYIPGHVVDHRCDTLVESFVVHSTNIGARRMRLWRKTSSILYLNKQYPLCVDMMMILTKITRCNCTNQMYALTYN